MNPLLPNTAPQQQRKSSAFEEAMTSFVKMTQTNFQEMKASQEVVQINNEASMKSLENQIGHLAKQIANQSSRGFSGNTQDNPKNESCKVIELRSKKILTPLVSKVTKKNEDVVVEESEKGAVEKNENGVVEKEKKEKKL